MSKKRVLFVTQELDPYTTLSEISTLVKDLPQYAQSQGMEIRVLMPKFGTINERRHRLHEVVRLSGMNIIVDDDDFPLIIKVASLPGARLQVYFLDNEEFFKRKFIFDDDKGKPYEDNQDRMVFFCKGVLETVKKFGWPPDIIHCHGWMTALVPLYLKSVYANEPIFENTKMIYSAYDHSLEDTFTQAFLEKASINNLDTDLLKAYKSGTDIKLHHGAIKFSDAVIKGSAKFNRSLNAAIKKLEIPVLDAQDEESFKEAYINFYKEMMEAE